MTVVYQPGLVLIKPQYTDASGRTHENVTWWKGTFSTPLTNTQLTAVVGEFNLNWANSWAKIGATNATFTGSIIQDYSSSSGLSFFNSSSTATGNLSTPAPINAAFLISLPSSTRYRGGHGRVYMPCLGETITTDGVNVNTGGSFWGTFQTDFAAFITGMAGISSGNGGPYQFAIYHQRRKSIAPYVELANGYVLNTKLATQRRRLRKAAHL